MSSERVEGLRRALEVSPDNHAVRALLAETLESEGRIDEALEHYEELARTGGLDSSRLVPVGLLAVSRERVSQAARCLDLARAAGVVEGVEELRSAVAGRLSEEEPAVESPTVPPPERWEADDEIDSSGLEPRPEPGLGPAERTATFSDVGGLDEVKKTIHRTIVLPYQRPDLYLRYGRRAGGGVMLYGAPGCGKTLLARATAGECGLPFFNVRIEQILDPLIGQSERNLHEAFELARLHAPCVLFIDELDGLAYARRKQYGGASRALVDQLLQELDAIGSDNRDVLILSATNAPWDVDDGLKRPGRLDRLLFVPPPDAAARQRILELLLADRPTGAGIDVRRLVDATRLFSGADVEALVERAVDEVIEEALDTGGEPPLSMLHLETALAGLRPTTTDWLRAARNVVEFGNRSGEYDEVSKFLSSREGKAARK